jgi:hypothetical protein
MQKSIEELNELVRAIPKKEAKNIAIFLENKLGLLKSCYDKSEKHFKVKILELIEFRQLRCFFTGEQFRDSSGSRVIELKDILYSIERIQDHIEDGLPISRQWKAIAFYSFYFGGYRAFFRCFTKEFLTKSIKLDEAFMKDVFTSTTTYLDKPKDFQDNNKSHKHLNIIPSIDVKESVLRVDILEDVYTLILKHKKVNINGLSGIGKTFIAKHFSQHFAVQFANMIWLNCAEGFPESFSQEKGIGLLGSLGLANEYGSYIGNEKGLMNLIIGYLSKIDGNNLLILDNLDSSINLYKDEINLLSKNWNILATSQEQLKSFENYAAPDIKKESLELFYTFYTIEKDDDNLIRLLSAIEYHTLTIELLAITAHQRGLSIIALVNRFAKKGINIVEQVEIIIDHGVERKSNIENIEQYLEIIFDTSSIKDELCKILLNIALMQGDSIPLDLFEEVYLNELYSEDLLDNLRFNISSLIKKGWVKLENNSIKLHSIVKRIIIKRYIGKDEFLQLTIHFLIKKIKIQENINLNLEANKYYRISENIIENSKGFDLVIINVLEDKFSDYCIEIGLFEKGKEIKLKKLDKLLKHADLSGKEDEYIELLFKLIKLFLLQDEIDNALALASKLVSFFGSKSDKVLQKQVIEKLNFFFIENKIKNIDEFQNRFQLSNLIEKFNIFLLSKVVLIRYNKNEKDLIKIIDELNKVFIQNNELLKLFEENIPKELIHSIAIYNFILINNSTICLHISDCYLKLKLYSKAEQYAENAFNLTHNISEAKSYLYPINRQFTRIYLESKNIALAKKYINLNKAIVENLTYYHPLNSILQKDLFRLKLLEDKFNCINNQTIEAEFENLFKVNSSSTKITDYFNILHSIHFKGKDYEKAIEYVKKEINYRLSLDNEKLEETELIDLIFLYLNLGLCHYNLDDLNQASNSLNEAIQIYKLFGVTDIRINEFIIFFTKSIIKSALITSQKTIVNQCIDAYLYILKREIIIHFTGLPYYNTINTIIDKVVDYLYSFSKTEEFLSETISFSKINVFFSEYNDFYFKIKEVEDIKNRDPDIIHFHQIILDKYYERIINMFFESQNWRLTIKYCKERLFLLTKYFGISSDFGHIHYTLSFSYFQIKQFEIALEEVSITKEIFYNLLGNNLNNETVTIEIKKNLNKTLELELLIKDELNKYC